MVEPNKVLDWLKANERTQVWLAAKAGITSSHLNHWLTGRHAMSADTLGKIADLIGFAPVGIAAASEGSDGGTT